MAEQACPGCLERDKAIAELPRQLDELRRQLRDLQTRLGTNASNSSLPPSANPPDAPKPVVKKATGRKPGAQHGHPPLARMRLPTERLAHVIALIPHRCERCHQPLPDQPQPGDPEPTWHQVAELPRSAALVTEFQGHARRCTGCGHVTRERLPAPSRADVLGPRLAATVAYLSGCQHVSKRGLEQVVETVFDVPVSLGSLARAEQQVAEALAGPHQAIAAAVQAAPVKHADETGWKLAGARRWLWVAVTATAAYFLLHARRGAAALAELLGERIEGVVVSDRWSAYSIVELTRRQLCWAHLVRDFRAMLDRGGAATAIGEELLELSGLLFDMWYKVRDGTRTRRWLGRQVEGWLRNDVVVALERGAACSCVKTAGVCVEILKVESALWAFASVEGVEPTNNAAERALRPAVLWRKGSLGSQSEGGCRFVERLLSVSVTLRKRGGRVLDYLREALNAHRHGLPIPKLLSAD
jgi:transposase